MLLLFKLLKYQWLFWLLKVLAISFTFIAITFNSKRELQLLKAITLEREMKEKQTKLFKYKAKKININNFLRISRKK
jgi:hypothetical protein